MKKQHFIGVLVAVIAVAVCLAQSGTYPPSNATENSSGKSAAWTPNSNVTVYLNTQTWGQPGSSQYQAIVNAFQAVSGGYRSVNVSFNFVPTNGPAQPSPAQYYVVVQQGFPPNAANAGVNNYNVYWNYNSPTAQVQNSTITINPNVTDPSALSSWIVHEASHTFALGDCTTCSEYSTVMSYQGRDFNTPTLYAPTYNDSFIFGVYYE